MNVGDYAKAVGMSRGEVRRLAREGKLHIERDAKGVEHLDPNHPLNREGHVLAKAERAKYEA